MFWGRSLSLEEERKKINDEYLSARQQLSAYKNQMPDVFHISVDHFIESMNALHEQACVPTSALIKAIKNTEGFLKGEVTSAAYGQVIHEMNQGRTASYEPSRLSQAMVTLSWAVWVVSLACLLAGPFLLGVIGLFVSYAIYQDAGHSEVKYPNAHAQHDATQIGEQMEKIWLIKDCGVPVADRPYAPA
ncbi:MAG: hypothetical protein P1U36_09720 [Legionellaceae bacterium]|nr:hypothetical protein [Legionellaceae bacterium]